MAELIESIPLIGRGYENWSSWEVSLGQQKGLRLWKEHDTHPNRRSASCVKPRVDGKQLKELQRENARLKRMLADEIPLGDGSLFYRVVEQ